MISTVPPISCNRASSHRDARRSSVNRVARIAALVGCIVTISACDVLTGVLPSAGPTRNQLFAGSVQREGNAFVVEVNQRVTAATSMVPALGFPHSLLNAGVANTDVIRSGDELTLTVYENVTDGLLAGGGSNASQISTLQVDSSGYIFIPYAGRIRAAGNTPNQVREIITRALDEQTPDPQVILSREVGNGASVILTSEFGGTGVFPIERPTRMLSGVLAASGGPGELAEVARVTLVRGGQSGTVWYEDVFRNPSIDVALRPDDRIIIERDSRRFTALGATGAQTIVPFDTQVLSAIDAIASVGGLNASRADPTGVFVLRNEPADLANLVLDRNDLTGTQRMIYVLDLTTPTGLFEARDFLIRDGDTVYVTSAPITQFNTAISALTGTLSGVTGVTDAVSGS